jgi:hypothetical protein
MPEKFKGKKTEKAGAAVEEEHLLSFIDANEDDVEVDFEFYNDGAFVQVELSLEDEDVEEKSLSQIRPTLQALNSPNMWIGDTGATKHSTKHKQGGINSRPSTSKTRGISGKAIKPSMEVDLPGMYCDKNGDDQFAVKLRDVDVIPESHYNLISVTKLMEEGHKVTGNKKDGLSVEKGGRIIKFDIRVETPKGVLWCAYIQRSGSEEGEVAAGMSDDKGDNQPNRSVILNPAIKMSIDRAHAILGHSSEGKTRQTAAALGILITRGALKTCESCAIAQAKQKNVNDVSEGEKAVEYNGESLP